MSKLPKISVVIPCLNKVDFIEKTLDSIVKQDYPNLEVIIQDGGSTDGSLEIIKKFADKYNQISYESKKDKGQADAINKGLSKATGEILSYINADDVYEKGALVAVGEAFNSNGEAFNSNKDVLWLAGKGKIINEKGREITGWATRYKNLLLRLNKYQLLLMVNYLVQPSVFLSSKAYEKYGPFEKEKRAVVEYDLWLKLGKKKMPLTLNKYLSSFRITKDTISATLYRKVLAKDYQIAAKHTKNPFILFLHYLNNLGRIATIYFLNR